MKTVIFIVVGFCIFCVLFTLISGDTKRKMAVGQGYYLGSCSNIDGNGYKIGCLLDKDKFYINTPISKKIDLKIPIDKVKNIEVKTEMQIKEHVTLGRLCVLGMFAFLAPKKQRDFVKYLIVEYENNNQMEYILLQLEGQNTCNNFVEAFNNIKQLSQQKLPV